jgi:hypothetical protein
MGWISTREELPPWFINVIVWGKRERENAMKQAYHARRFTGMYTGLGEIHKDAGEGYYLTPCDGYVTEVTHWMPLPENTPPRSYDQIMKEKEATN